MSKKKQHGFVLYKRLLKFVFIYWRSFSFAMVGNVGYAAVMAYTTYLFKPVLNEGFIGHNHAYLHILPVIVLAVFIVAGFMNMVGSYFMGRVSNGVVKDFRQKLFEKYMQLPASYFDRSSSGELLSVILFNVTQLANAGSDALTTLVQSFCQVVGLLVVMFTINWKLSLIFIVSMPIVSLSVQFSSKRIRKLSMRLQQEMGDVTSIAEEAIEGYKVVRAYGGQSYEIDKFNHATFRNYQRQLKVIVTSSFTVSGVQLIVALFLAFIVFLAASPHSVLNLSAGGFVAIFAAMLSLLKPLKNFTKVNSRIQTGLAGAQSVFDVLDYPIEEDNGQLALVRANGEVKFESVSFTYPGTEKTILTDVSFSVSHGKTVAFVGHSGAGKSTIISILQRFYTGWQGNILMDDQPIQDYKLSDYRQQFAIVSQHVTLFNDTIAHNIAYGQFADATEEQIIEAAKAANAWEFIKEMPDGLNTLIGENGVLLSGGQRQRLAIARAIIKNAPILILDEATSALDTESERLIQDALVQLMKKRTTLVIAHRLSTIENADLIIVLKQGQVIEQGCHAELLAKGGAYASLYKLQFREEEST